MSSRKTLNLKLRAEFYGFENFKDVPIFDRLVAGIDDNNFRQRLLSEGKLNLAITGKKNHYTGSSSCECPPTKLGISAYGSHGYQCTNEHLGWRGEGYARLMILHRNTKVLDAM